MANTLALGARVAVRVRHLLPEVKDYSLAFLYSSVVQLVERTTVNRDGTGSSPVRGAKKYLSEVAVWQTDRAVQLLPKKYALLVEKKRL